MLLQVWSQWQSGSNCPSPPATSSRGSSGRNHLWHTQWSCPGCCPDLPAAHGRHYKIKNSQLLNFTAFCCFLKTSFKLSQSRMPAQNLCSRKWLCGGIWLNLWLLYVMSLSRFSSAVCDMWDRLYLGSEQDRPCRKTARINLAPVGMLAKQESSWPKVKS